MNAINNRTSPKFLFVMYPHLAVGEVAHSAREVGGGALLHRQVHAPSFGPARLQALAVHQSLRWVPLALRGPSRVRSHQTPLIDGQLILDTS